jgi:hypothetical protein
MNPVELIPLSDLRMPVWPPGRFAPGELKWFLQHPDDWPPIPYFIQPASAGGFEKRAIDGNHGMPPPSFWA